MKKLLYPLFIVHFSLLIDLHAATCPSDFIEITDDNYKIVGDSESCGSDWFEVNDSNLQPFLPAATDGKGSYTETICIVQ